MGETPCDRARATGKGARWCLAAWAPSRIEPGPSGTRPRTSLRPAPPEPAPYELSGETAKMCHRGSVTYRHVRHARPELARSGATHPALHPEAVAPLCGSRPHPPPQEGEGGHGPEPKPDHPRASWHPRSHRGRMGLAADVVGKTPRGE